MPRVKGGVTTRRRRKKIMKLAKGYFGSRRTLYRTAHEQVMRSLAFAYRDRKQRKRNFRKLWISRINAAATANGIKYSKLIHGLQLANVTVNRKVLADLAVFEPNAFVAYVNLAKDALANPTKAVKVAPVKATPAKAAEKVAEVKAAPAKKEASKEASSQFEKVLKAGVPANEEALKKAEASLAKLLVADLKEVAAFENVSETKKADLVIALAKLGYVAR